MLEQDSNVLTANAKKQGLCYRHAHGKCSFEIARLKCMLDSSAHSHTSELGAGHNLIEELKLAHTRACVEFAEPKSILSVYRVVFLITKKSCNGKFVELNRSYNLHKGGKTSLVKLNSTSCCDFMLRTR